MYLTQNIITMINNVVLVGNMTADAGIKEITEGVKVANFTVAINESYNKPSGEKVEKTQWIQIVAWRKLAEIIEKVGGKGKLVAIEGKLETRTFEKDGNTQYITEVIADNFRVLSKKEE